MAVRTWKTNLDGLSPDSLRICRRILAELWTTPEVDFSGLDEIQTRALTLLQRSGYVVRDRETGRYYLGERAYLEPAA